MRRRSGGRSQPGAEPPQLRGEVGPRAALAAALGDRALEPLETRAYGGPIRPHSPTLALGEPVGRRSVAPLAIAGAARDDLVLRPRRPTLQARDHVVERHVPIARRERAAAPDALWAVAEQNALEPLGAREVARDRVVRGHSAHDAGDSLAPSA